MTLLQITETIGADTVKQVVQAVQALPEVAKAVVPEQLNLLALILKGGWVMYPIAALSIMGFYIFFERYFTLRKANKDDLAAELYWPIRIRKCGLPIRAGRLGYFRRPSRDSARCTALTATLAASRSSSPQPLFTRSRSR